MATRNLSQKYAAARAASRTARASRPPPPSGHSHQEDELTSVLATPGQERPTDENTPEWVQYHDKIVEEVVRIKENLRTLQKYHTARLKVSFGADQAREHQQNVDGLTNEITNAIRRSEGYVKTIATIGNNGTLTSQERTTRLNVMRSLGTELTQASKSFRHIQKDFFRNLREQEKIGEQYFTSADGSSSVSLEDALNTELTSSQVAELAQIEAQANDREKEIIRIAQSVNELATLFKELNMLVIEQGTILDRIDYNIETSLVKIKKGVVDLEDAEKQSKRALGFRCLLIMIIIVCVLFIVFVIRKSI